MVFRYIITRMQITQFLQKYFAKKEWFKFLQILKLENLNGKEKKVV